MAEGFFRPDQLGIPGMTTGALCAAMVRILPRTILVLDMDATAEDARHQARNESLPDGSECWYRFFNPDDLSRVDDPEFAMGMVRHEFARAVKAGAAFPVTVPLDGGGSGFAIDAAGHVLTNYHLVTSEVANHRRQGGAIDADVLCKSLRVQVAQRDSAGDWHWRDADSVWLTSNPPADRAIVQVDGGHAQLREDTALLRVEPPPSAHFRPVTRPLQLGETVWMAGFPLRSARDVSSLERMGYSDADGSLRVTTGRVLAIDPEGCFVSDIDGSMGNSGSPVFDSTGGVVGVFSRTVGNGPRNAFAYGHLNRVHVASQLAIDGLALSWPAL
jgi:S1-C subfamily serine protease